jgi:PAS domain S-box-containing protein
MADTGALESAAFAASQRPMAVLDGYGTFLAGNPAFFELTGRPLSPGERLETLAAGDEARRLRALMDGLEGAGASAGITLALPGIPVRMRITLLDLPGTERRFLLEPVEETGVFSAVARFVPGAVFIKDDGGRYVFVNGYMSRLFGRDSWFGRTTGEVFPPGSADNLTRGDRRAMDEGMSDRFEEVTDDSGITKTYRVVKFRIDRGAAPPWLGGIALDVTRQREMEKALRDSERRYRAVFENTGAATIIIEEDTTISLANRGFEQLSGLSTDQVTGRMRFPSFFAPDDARRMLRYHRARRRGKGRAPKNYGAVFTRPDGEKRQVLLRVDMIPGTSRSVASILDITERRSLEEMLRQRQKMEAVGTLAGGVAHDFNNLLTSILGYADLLRAALPEDSEPGRAAAVIETAAQRAADLTRKLLGFARRGRIRNVGVDVNALVDEVVDILRRTIPPSIDVKTRLDGRLEPVVGDPGQLQQVLLNLAVNARDAMPDGGELEFRSRRVEVSAGDGLPAEIAEGGYVELSVRDTGRGIPEDSAERIFEPFFTTKGDEGRGTGLGLAMVYGIVHGHGGHIDVRSAPGEGSTFRVLLPERPGAELAGTAGDGGGSPPRGQGSILVVDDEETVRSVVRTMLESMGYSVTVAADGIEAIRMFTDMKPSPDLVIMDMTMPRMGGVECARRLREIDGDVPVLVATGHSTELAEEAPDFEGYIQKPFAVARLAEAVKSVLRSRS